jgi:hypothetical protein
MDMNNISSTTIVAIDSINSGNNVNLGFAPIATTDIATNINGNSATLNATVNSNGSDTTIYFEWGTNTTYGNTTTPQSIGSGTSDVSVSNNVTGLSTTTTYHFRVVATNAWGTSYGEDVSFTTPPITLTITSPLEADIIFRPDVLVRGTVTNTTDNETGVTVNETVAVSYNGEFFVNHVPLEEGQNTITVTATDTEDNKAATSLMITVNTTTPYVTLQSNIESGITPLKVNFSVSTAIPNTVSNYQIDFESDGIIDYEDNTFEDVNFTYTDNGIHYPTLTIIDTNGTPYSDTIAIAVLDTINLDALLKAKWEAMKTALENQDISGALNYYTEASQELYNDIFNALYDQLPQLVQDMQDIQLIYIKDGVAKYRIRKNELYGGQIQEITYYIYFVIDEDGIWKIEIF